MVLIAANVAMYVYTSLLSGNFVTTNIDVLAYYGQYNLAVFRGYYWQLISSMFVHVDIVHIGSNMLFLFIFGLRAEELLYLPTESQVPLVFRFSELEDFHPDRLFQNEAFQKLKDLRERVQDSSAFAKVAEELGLRPAA